MTSAKSLSMQELSLGITGKVEQFFNAEQLGDKQMKIIQKAFLLVIVTFSLATCAQTDPSVDIMARAQNGYSEAQYELGLRYAQGRGVDQNETEAAKWFRLAADQGYANAQNILGAMYLEGRGVVQNDLEAVKWFRLAERNGVVTAGIRAESTLRLIENAAQGRDCSSNSDEIIRQIYRLSDRYDARIAQSTRRLSDRDAFVSGGVSRTNLNDIVERNRDLLTAEKARDIAFLRSRVVEICEPSTRSTTP